MKENKAVYVTKRDFNAELNRDYQFYATNIIRDGVYSPEPVRYGPKTLEVGCQYDCKRDNLICTCKYLTTPRRRQQEVRYFGSPKHSYQGSRSFTDIGVGSVKALQRKKVKRIYLPETNDRGVGSSDLSSYILQRPKQQSKDNGYYENKRTSSKCVGGILEYNIGCIINKKLSPIVQTISGSTSYSEFNFNNHIEIGNSAILRSIANTTTQIDDIITRDVEIDAEVERKITKDIKADSEAEIEQIEQEQFTIVQPTIMTQNDPKKVNAVAVDKSKPAKLEDKLPDRVSSDLLRKPVKTKHKPTERVSSTESLRQLTKSKAKPTDRLSSSDSLLQHVHNLENPSIERNSRVSIEAADIMENKLELEYRSIFAAKSKSKDSKHSAQNSTLKSTSTLRRRFEALRRGLAKKNDSKKNSVMVKKESSQVSTHSHKDVSINSDPPSLEGRSFSNMKPYSPFTMKYSRDRSMHNPRSSHYRRPVSDKKERGSAEWSSKGGDDDSETHGVKGMFKLWGKKFNLEEGNYSNIQCTPKPSYNPTRQAEIKKIDIIPMIQEPPPPSKPDPDRELDTEPGPNEKKEGRRFFFFKNKKKNKEKEKEKEKPFKTKKGVTTGRCEVRDGLVINILGDNVYKPEDIPKEPEITADDYEGMVRKSWLKKFLTPTIESRNSVKVRWNNKTYAPSSSTVFELMGNIYKDTSLDFRSKSQVTVQSSYKSHTRQHVNFMKQNIEAWMIPKTFTDRPKLLPVKQIHKQFTCKSDEDTKDTMEVSISDQKWYIDKSKAFSHKIEVVLHSKNFKKLYKEESSEYLKIDIPKGFFMDSSNEEVFKCAANQSSDEEVFKIVEYETGSDLKKDKATRKISVGDHKQNKIKVTVSVLETSSQPTSRDVVVQGSHVFIPRKCDVVGVGIITHRDLSQIRKPILKIQDDFSDEESEHIVLRPNTKKCEFAESYLQDYYRHWTPLGIDLFSWCASDSQLKCCSENSRSSFQNQGDVTKSCPNIFEDFHTATIVSSCGASSCSQNKPAATRSTPPVYNLPEKGDKKKKKGKEKDKKPDPDKRILPKDSIEVFKRRKIYSATNKSKWVTPYTDSAHLSGVPSVEQFSPQHECPKLRKSCCKPREQPNTKKRPCKKHVSLPDCDTMNNMLLKQLGTSVPESILAYKGSSGCDVCKRKEFCPKHATVIPTPSCEIPRAPCRDSCEHKKKPACSASKTSCENPPPGPRQCPKPQCPPQPNPPAQCPSNSSPSAQCPPNPRSPAQCPPKPCPPAPVSPKPKCPSPPRSDCPTPPPTRSSPQGCPPPEKQPAKNTRPCGPPSPPSTPPCCKKTPPRTNSHPTSPHVNVVATCPPQPQSPPPQMPPCPPSPSPPPCPPSLPPTCPYTPPCKPLPNPPPCPPPAIPCRPPPTLPLSLDCPSLPPSCPPFPRKEDPCLRSPQSYPDPTECACRPPCTPPMTKNCLKAPPSCTSPPRCCTDPNQCPASPPPCQKTSIFKKLCKKIQKSNTTCPDTSPCKQIPCEPAFCKPLAYQQSFTSVSYTALHPDAPFYYSPIHPCAPELVPEPKIPKPKPMCHKFPCTPDESPESKPMCHKSPGTPNENSDPNPMCCKCPGTPDENSDPKPMCCKSPGTPDENSYSKPMFCKSPCTPDDEFPWPTKNQVSNQSSKTSLCQESYGKCMKDCPMMPQMSCETVPSVKECKPSCPNFWRSPLPCLSQIPGMQCPSPPHPCPSPPAEPLPVPRPPPIPSKSKPKVSGLFLKMTPTPNKKSTCSKDCLAWENGQREGCISLSSTEKITIRLKKQTASTEEIREGLNIKVQDEDGMTLFERKDYSLQHADCSLQRQQSLLGEMYKASEVHRVNTNNSTQALGTDKETRKEIREVASDVSIANLIEIQFKLKVTQGDKTTEINIANDGDKDENIGRKEPMKKSTPEVYIVKNEDERPTEHSDQKNDINIRIVIKNFKPKSRKRKSVNVKQDDYNDFSKNISAKFHTVSTGYSDVFRDDHAYSVHRATVDLTSSVDNTRTETTSMHSYKTDHSVTSVHGNKSVQSNKTDQSIKDVLNYKSEHSNITGHSIKSVHDNKSVQSNKTDQSIKDVLNYKSEHSNITDHSIKSVHENKSVHSHKTDQSIKNVGDNKSMHSNKTDHSIKDVLDYKSVHSNKTNQSTKSLGDNKSMHSNKSVHGNRSLSSNKRMQINKSVHTNKSLHSNKTVLTVNSVYSNKSNMSEHSLKGILTKPSVCSKRSLHSNNSVHSNKSMHSNKSVPIKQSVHTYKSIHTHKSVLSNKSAPAKRSIHSNRSVEIIDEPAKRATLIGSSDGSVGRYVTTDDEKSGDTDAKSFPSLKYSNTKEIQENAEETDTQVTDHKYEYNEDTDTEKPIKCDTEETDTDRQVDHPKYDTETDTERKQDKNYDTFMSTSETDELDTLPEIRNSHSLDIIAKPQTKEENKELLKHVMEKVHNTKLKNKTRMRKLRDMLKVILTSDSSDHDDTRLIEPANDLAKDVTYASLKPNYFRDTDSMHNYYKTESKAVLSDTEINRQVVYPSAENNTDCSNSAPSVDFVSSDNVDSSKRGGGCMCSTVAERLKLASRIGEVRGCCCSGKQTNKKNEETICDLKRESDYHTQIEYKTTEFVNVHTQNSRYLTSKLNSTNLSAHSSIKASRRPSFNYEGLSAGSGVLNVDSRQFSLKKTISPEKFHLRECEMRKRNMNAISDEEKIVLRSGHSTRLPSGNVKARDEKQEAKTHAADILQSYEVKKAVLEIYTEKTISDGGEHLVAKLPKFVYDREQEIHANYEAMANNTYKAVCKKNIIMMAIKR